MSEGNRRRVEWDDARLDPVFDAFRDLATPFVRAGFLVLSGAVEAVGAVRNVKRRVRAVRKRGL